MSRFIRSQSRLLRQICGNSQRQFLQQQQKYSQQINEPVVSRKKKYIYTAFLGVSLIGFGYYIAKEREYGNLI